MHVSNKDTLTVFAEDGILGELAKTICAGCGDKGDCRGCAGLAILNELESQVGQAAIVFTKQLLDEWRRGTSVTLPGDKTVTVILVSGFGQDEIDIPADLWQEFEAAACKLRIPVKQLLLIALHASVPPSVKKRKKQGAKP